MNTVRDTTIPLTSAASTDSWPPCPQIYDKTEDHNGCSPIQLINALWADPALCHQMGFLDKSTGRFQNRAVEDGAAATASVEGEPQGVDIFVACAEYDNLSTRTATNVVQANAFWFDIDCGVDKASSGKGYATLEEAHREQQRFCKDADIPPTTHLVHSGAGLHGYIAVTRPIPRDRWLQAATKLKGLARHFNFLADPTRTADIASVMRMPGTLNYKYDPPRPVILVAAAPALDTDAVLDAINAAHTRCFPPSPSPSRTNSAANDEPPDLAGGRASTYGAPDLAALSSALRFLDPDCDEATWKLHRLAPLANASREHPTLSHDLYRLAKSWSSGELRGTASHSWTTPGESNGLTGAECFEQQWARFLKQPGVGIPVTVGTIYFHAKEMGWTFPTTNRPTTEPSQVQAANDPNFKEKRVEVDPSPTHHGYAMDVISRLTVNEHEPVAHDGSLFVVDPASSLWVRRDIGLIVKLVAQTHDGKPNCKRSTDYSGIANHARSMVNSETFFSTAPVGLACPEGFYRIDGDEAILEALTPNHRQRVRIDVSPLSGPTPLFDAFLHETFSASLEGEEQQQISLLQEIAGAVMLGLMPRHHKAVLFYDPFGRAGKGTTESILRALVPPTFVTAVSPFNWNKEYFVATLAGSRLNVVGELPQDEAIPAAIFKSVTGGDLITGRNPTQSPITFKNEAAHIFMSNHLITSKDQSEAFFGRWLILEFPNSRLRSGAPLDTTLAERIVKHELPSIAHWALEGAKRLLRNNRFSQSEAHDRLMQKWRSGNSSLTEFIDECCDLDPTYTVKRSHLYQQYVRWCSENGRKPYSKSNVKDLLQHNVGLGISLAVLDGFEIFRGAQMKQVDFDL